jgi:uncharacterized protein
MHWLLYCCLFALLLTGLALAIMTLPGLWLMLAVSALYAWGTGWQYLGWKTLGVLLALAALAEVIEITSAGAGARRAGGGRRGMWGAIIGGIIGGVVLTIPLWFVGTLIGVCIGTFAGAMIGEFSRGHTLGRSVLIGASAAGGRLKGTLIKVGFGCLMLVIAMWTAFPVGGGAKALAVPGGNSRQMRGPTRQTILPLHRAPSTIPSSEQ